MVSSIDNNNIRTHCYYPNYVLLATNRHHRPPFSTTNDAAHFQHPDSINNFPIYHEYLDNFCKRELNQNQRFRTIPKHFLDDHGCLLETATRGYGVRRYVDRFQFPHEIQCAGQPATDGYYPPSFRSIHEVGNPAVRHHHHSNPPTDQLSSYLAPPALDHVEQIYVPTNMVMPPVPNRASCKGRFNTTKLMSSLSSSSSFKSQLPPSFKNNKDLRDIDIVCGRGKHALFHKGNKTFRDLILQHQSTYLFSKRSEKARLAWNVFDIISSYGGRFVRRVKKKASRYESSTSNTSSKKSSCCYNWEQLNERQAHEKICQSLREGAPELRRRMLQRSKEEEREKFVMVQKHNKANKNSKRNDKIQ